MTIIIRASVVIALTVSAFFIFERAAKKHATKAARGRIVRDPDLESSWKPDYPNLEHGALLP
jgi:hypothetical protein